MKYVKCYCLRKRKEKSMYCPLTTDVEDLKKTFNYQVRGDEIVEVEIEETFVCYAERKEMCKNCPFK